MKKYLISLSALSILFFLLLLPVSSLKLIDIENIFRAYFSKSSLFIYGNSVLKTKSKCDSSADTVADLINKNTDILPSDLSRGGMRLGNMLVSAQALATLSSKGSIFLFPISLETGSFNVSLDTNHVTSFLKKNNKLFDTEPIVDLNSVTTYKGIHYGNYSNFSQEFFNYEKAKMSCPENIGSNLNFVEYMYYRNFIQRDTSDLLQFDEIRQQLKSIVSKGQTVILVLMPINYDDIRALHGDLSVNLIDQRVANIKEQLKEFAPIDLSKSVSDTGFSDRWCACGHLNQAGRKVVSARISNALKPKSL